MTMSDKPIVRIRNLHRIFGNVHAVRGVSFDIMPGQVVGFIGSNGAGKTTTMRMMATLELPTRGYVEVCGCNAVMQPLDVRRKIGWMPDSYGTYANMTVWEYLDFFARAYGLQGDDRKKRVEEVMEFADLTTLRERQMSKLSKGMSQRLCLGRTLLHDPELLILDEPAAGLDPKARIEFKNLVRILASQGKTIFISSHILSELGEMCNHLLFIDRGKIVHSGSSDSLRYESTGEILCDVKMLGPVKPLLDWCELHPGVEVREEVVDGALVAIEGSDNEAQARVLARLVQDGVPILEFTRRQLKLEDAFVNMIKKLEGEEQNASGK